MRKRYKFTEDELYELVFQVAGAATAPLLVDNPTYVFPAERVYDSVCDLLVHRNLPDYRR